MINRLSKDRKPNGILFVINTWENRGAEQQLKDLRKSLRGKVVSDVFIFTMHDTGCACYIKETSAGDSFFHFPRFKNRLAKSLYLLKFILNYQYDVIITEGLGTALFFGRVWGLICGPRVIYSTLHTFHNLNREDGRYFEPQNKLLNRILPLISFRHCFRYLSIFKKLTLKVRSQTPGYPVSTLWNAISEDFVKRHAGYTPNKNIKDIADLVCDKDVLIQIGAVDKNKNQIFAVKCLKKILPEFPDLKLLIVGDGPQLNEIAKYIKENKLNQNVFLTGQIKRSECFYLLSKSDILLLTSFTEAFPVVFLEAMLNCLPIVSFEVGGASDVIENGTTGFLTPANDMTIFTTKITHLLRNPSLIKSMGNEGKKKLYKQFTMSRKCRMLLAMIRYDLKKINKI
jgi:glycosyltransferase involved in cell wall biosynthesis